MPTCLPSHPLHRLESELIGCWALSKSYFRAAAEEPDTAKRECFARSYQRMLRAARAAEDAFVALGGSGQKIVSFLL